MAQRSLTDIANSHGTDKGTAGPSRHWRAHNYTDVYEAYLWSWRDKAINLLEIGLGVPGGAWDAKIAHGRNGVGGASMKTWSEYFPHARIFGIDINPASFLDTERISTHVVDQGSTSALDSFLEGIGDVSFDVIIDDGSHRPDHQQISLGRLFPRLRTGGLYFIEDLLTNGHGDGRRGRSSAENVLNTRRLLKTFQASRRFVDSRTPSATRTVSRATSVTSASTSPGCAPGWRAVGCGRSDRSGSPRGSPWTRRASA